MEENPYFQLKDLKIKNPNRLVIGQININSLRNKWEQLVSLTKDNVDIMVVTETKLDETFPKTQFTMEGYHLPFRVDRDTNGGGVMVIVKGHIPCRELDRTRCRENHLEGIFLEINLRKRKFLLFGGYNFNKSNIDVFLKNIGPILDKNMSNIDNFLLLGDFNSEVYMSKV